MKTQWRLPRGVDELLPPQAWELELLRRDVLDVFDRWGFDYIEPPIIEYLDALLVGSGEDLDLQTLKVVDQVSGKQLGVRADMTSQALRIDAHSRLAEGVQRLCYAGPVVFANPVLAQSSRVPFKAGAEIFGAAGLNADAEVVGLMLATLQVAQVQQPVLLLGHVGIYQQLVRELLDAGELDEPAERRLFQCVQRKSQADIAELLSGNKLSRMMASLPTLMGDHEVLDRARRELADAPVSVRQAIDELEELYSLVRALHGDVVIRLDVAELSGYGYHNGPVFAVYHPEHGSALAQGGRYDHLGEVFGRARSATGFDVNLKNLLGSRTATRQVIFAPWVANEDRDGLVAAVQMLRDDDKRVRFALHAGESPGTECSHELVPSGEGWQIQPIGK